MSWPNSLKTVFVIDHGPVMARASDLPIELDVFNKSRSHGAGAFIPVTPVCKSLWTCAAEASFEYCRIVWDIYPTGRLIRFMICDTKVNPVGSWGTNQQNLTSITYHFAQLGVPVSDSRLGDSSIMHGLTAALEALTECSDAQLEKLKSAENKSKVHNRGRVICISSFREDGYVRSLESFFQETILQINQRNFPPTHMPIHHCDFVVVNIFPNPPTITLKEHPRLELSPLLSCELISVCASRWLASRLVSLVLQHYELASTTVTGIPMKEEQNASSSANYDVEIFHPVSAHADILKLKNESALFLMKEGYGYKTVTLKWCTPRATSNSVEMWPCSSAYRISPVDVTSRPSSCLTNFLLGGRSVMLELPRSGTGGRTTSHMLAAHGGEIFLHSLLIGRSVIEDPPSISEGSGGRVTDYRIPDFGELMKENKLVPYLLSEPFGTPLPIERASNRMERWTQYWPMTISSTIVFNMGVHMETLTKIIVNEELTDDQVIECKKVIYNLLALESRNEPLPPTCSGHRDRGAKGNRREEQYRILFKECEIMLRHHCRSEQHRRVLACLLECRSKGTAPNPLLVPSSTKESAQEINSARSSIPDTPLSPVAMPAAKAPRLDVRSSLAGKSLLEVWNSSVSAEVSKKQREFVGRVKAGGQGPVKLYGHLDKEHET
ncbi:integrator complex subunit 13-like isoform X1 [Daphnia carinata]|uniref:integrator complex subunit 13-like isoform X1 n=2 Tax=Daphnia carinata TaxID=120202 RepID=UPI002579DA1D|nr:integrator complex subunit 13-like isoform X1 [Daphnia carinata]XP_057373955.1 integrator complex subunit 13-like isoform X1 [Daphnia carinata]